MRGLKANIVLVRTKSSGLKLNRAWRHIRTFIADYCPLIPSEQESEVCQAGIVEQFFYQRSNITDIRIQ